MQVKTESDAERRRRLNRVQLQQHCRAEDDSQRQQWQEADSQSLVVAASDSVAVLIYHGISAATPLSRGWFLEAAMTRGWLTWTHIKTVTSSIFRFLRGSPACIHVCPKLYIESLGRFPFWTTQSSSRDLVDLKLFPQRASCSRCQADSLIIPIKLYKFPLVRQLQILSMQTTFNWTQMQRHSACNK